MSGRRRTKRALTREQRENRAGLLLIGPTTIAVALFVIVPIVWALGISLQTVTLRNIGKVGVFGDYTFRNFRRVLTSDGFFDSLKTTIIYTFASTAGSIVVGLIAALALRAKFRGRSLVRALMLLPYVAPVVAVAFVWETMLNPQFGVVNAWGTSYLGWDDGIAFLSQRSTALITVIVFEIWRYFPFAFLFIMARLAAVPSSLEEAARMDGATPWQNFRFVLLPMLLPTIKVLFLLRVLFTFNKFDDVFLLTEGGSGTEVASVRVYEFLVARKDVGGAAAHAVVLAFVMIAFIVIQARLTKGIDEKGLA